MSELIDRQDVIDRLKKAEDVFRQNGAKLEANGIHYALELVESDIEISTIESRKERPQGKWIPITYRPMTEEEVKRVETYFGLPLDEEDKKCFSCPMPEHGQEILISTKWGVSKDICLYDCDEGYGLDERGDWEDVDAWMPLPEKYNGVEMRGDDNG